MKESLRKRLLLVLFYLSFLGILLALSEGILSFFDPEAILVRADDGEQIYSFYPDRAGQAISPEYSVLVETDGRGLRRSPSRENGPRLLVLGDSFAEGWGVEAKDSFAGLLGQTYPVWNAGIHGGTPPYYILRHRVFRKQWNYNMLIIQIFDNDLDDIDKIYPFIEWHGDIVRGASPAPLFGWPGLSRLVKERALYRMARRAYHKSQGQPQPIKYYRLNRIPDVQVRTQEQALAQFGRLKPIADLKIAYNGQFLFYDPAERASAVWQRRFSLMEASLRQLISESHKESQVLIVYIPAKEVLAPAGIRGALGREPNLAEIRAANPLYQLLTNIEDKKVKLLDGQEVFLKHAESSYFPFDAHLNPAGHARLHRAIFVALGRMRLAGPQ